MRKCFVLVAVLIIGCETGYHQRLEAGYELSATDSLFGMKLVNVDKGYQRIVVSPTVVAIGADGRHLIVKQRPVRPGRVEFDATHYYIVELSAGPREPRRSHEHGPYDTLEKFVEARRTLGVSDRLGFVDVLSFTKGSGGNLIPSAVVAKPNGEIKSH